MDKAKKVIKIVGDVLVGIIVVMGLLLLVSLLPIKNNYKVLTVMSGSMEPTIKTGSLIVSQPTGQYETGDIITFSSAEDPKKTTTHRIVAAEEQNGAILYTTKGDANKSNDSRKIAVSYIKGKYLFGVPYIGYFLAFVKTLPGLLIIIIIPAAIIIYEELKKIAREAKNLAIKKKNNKRSKDEVSW